jgi:cell division septal protein FtsQ
MQRTRSAISSREPSTSRQSVPARRKNRRLPAPGEMGPVGSAIEISRRHSAKLMIAVGVAAGAALLALAGWQAKGWLLETDLFAIETVDVTGVTRAEEEAILSLANVQAGQNLLAIDTDEVARAVERHPWVKAARVSRRFMHQLSIEVSEHDPVLLVALGNLYYADRDGDIVKRQAPGEREALPLVTGLSREEVERGDGRAKARLIDAVRFLADLKKVTGAADVDEIHLDAVQGLSFVPMGDTIRVHVGKAPYQERLERLETVRRALSERSLLPLEITLGGEHRPERVVARLQPSETSPDKSQSKKAAK